jgi:hypothetical protein
MEIPPKIRERITQKIRMRIKDYQEVYLERFVEAYWEGLQEGLQEDGLKDIRDLLLDQMEMRFGLVPTAIRQKIEDIQDYEELKKIGKRLLAASSLDDLGL